MHIDDSVLDLMDRVIAALNSRDVDAVVGLVTGDIVFGSTSPPDGVRCQGRDAVGQVWGDMLAATSRARSRPKARPAAARVSPGPSRSPHRARRPVAGRGPAGRSRGGAAGWYGPGRG